MLLRRMRNYLLTGIIIILPIVISIYLIVFLFIKATDYIFNLFPGMYYDQLQLKILIRVIALGFLITGLILVGMFGRNVIGRRLLTFGESILLRIPLLGRVYVAVKQVSEAFLGYDKTILNKVCLVEYPRKGVHAIGFITSTAVGEVQYKTEKKVINVFVPTTPNPTSGTLIMIPEEDVTPLDMSIEDGLKLVISGGAVNPPYTPPAKGAPQPPR
ncbi:MAG: DUF502 domain-containing protein [Candidatus Auribacterota bacterium]